MAFKEHKCLGSQIHTYILGRGNLCFHGTKKIWTCIQ